MEGRLIILSKLARASVWRFDEKKIVVYVILLTPTVELCDMSL